MKHYSTRVYVVVLLIVQCHCSTRSVGCVHIYKNNYCVKNDATIMLPDLRCLACTPIDTQINMLDALKDTVCAICLNSLQEPGPDDAELVERLDNCKHEFHQSCIAGYLQVNQTANCPLCRTAIDPIERARLIAYGQPTTEPVTVAIVGSSPCDVAHGAGWDETTHWTSVGGWCGQSCPCCRYQVEGPDGFGICDICASCNVPRRDRVIVPSPTPIPRLKSFIYVVARQLGSGPTTSRIGPVLLMIGHKTNTQDPVRWEKWGVPGGYYDSTDQGTFYNAVREFTEELGLMPSRSARGAQYRTEARGFIKNKMRVMRSQGQLFRVAKNTRTGYTAYALVVDNALAFERAVSLKHAGQDIQRKATVTLSSETKGYTWVTSDSLNNARRVRSPTGVVYSAVPAPQLGHPLRLRRGVLGPQLSKAFLKAR
jgi:ADP-ribose pyrophosphatase YjhB (NUDIX family)